MRKFLILLSLSAIAACATAPSEQPEAVTAAAAGTVAPADADRAQIGSFETGALREWSTAQDREPFNALTLQLVARVAADDSLYLAPERRVRIW